MPAPGFAHRYAIVACARWESDYIVEWLTYYRAIGFDHVFLYCNDDDPGPLYERVLAFTLGPAPFVSFRHYAEQGEQARMYAHFLRHDLAKCEWIGFFDIDEFLRLPPDMMIADFMGRFGAQVDCVLFNWIFFGPNGHKTRPAGKVLPQYTRRDARIHGLTKYLARAAIFARETRDILSGPAFWHSPSWGLSYPINVVNVLGEPMDNYYDNFAETAEPWVNEPDRHAALLGTAIIHHYAFRSERAFFERAERGIKGDFAGQLGWRILAHSNGFGHFLGLVNAVTDLSLADFWARLGRKHFFF